MTFKLIRRPQYHTRDADGGGENSRTRGHDPYIPPEDGRNEGTLDKDDGGEEPTPHQRGNEE